MPLRDGMFPLQGRACSVCSAWEKAIFSPPPYKKSFFCPRAGEGPLHDGRGMSMTGAHKGFLPLRAALVPGWRMAERMLFVVCLRGAGSLLRNGQEAPHSTFSLFVKVPAPAFRGGGTAADCPRRGRFLICFLCPAMYHFGRLCERGVAQTPRSAFKRQRCAGACRFLSGNMLLSLAVTRALLQKDVFSGRRRFRN